MNAVCWQGANINQKARRIYHSCINSGDFKTSLVLPYWICCKKSLVSVVNNRDTSRQLRRMVTAEKHTKKKKMPWQRNGYNKNIFLYIILRNKNHKYCSKLFNNCKSFLEDSVYSSIPSEVYNDLLKPNTLLSSLVEANRSVMSVLKLHLFFFTPTGNLPLKLQLFLK